MTVTNRQRRWMGVLPLLVSFLILGCSPQVSTPTPVQAQPLALLVLTPGLFPHQPSAIRYQPSATEPILSPTPQPSPTTAVPSPTATFTPDPTTTRPKDQLTTTPFPTATPVPTPTSSPAATPTPRLAADRPPDRIVALTVGLDALVVEIGWHLVERNGQMVSEWDVADHAAGFHKGSAYPGCVGNTVLSGHHNIRGEVFRYLIELQPGDLVSLYVGEQEYRYKVQQVLLIPERDVSPEQRRENARWIGYFPDERLTMVTCWPYTSNTYRVIVIAHPEGRGS